MGIWIRIFIALSLLWTVLGCQSPPTVVVQRDKSLTDRSFSGVEFGAKKIDYSRSIFIDTRSRFEFELSRLPRSLHFYWKDWQLFSYKGKELELRVAELQRRLAGWGIDPFTRVVVFGNGIHGDGDEYFVAAILMALGVERIQVISPKLVSKALVHRKTETLPSVPLWQRSLQYSLVCSVENSSPQKVDKPKALLNEDLTFNVDNLLSNRTQGTTIEINKNNSRWSYGVAMTLVIKGASACISQSATNLKK